MSNLEDTIDFNLPAAVRDFIFDLHDGVRRSHLAEDVQRLYEVKYKEITDKYFPQSKWPDSRAIAAGVYDDAFFLALYSEMATRHITTKLRPQLADHLASWANYKKLFELIASSKEGDIYITTQWIYDITQEFAYQFQGFCQFRCQVATHSAETLRVLNANRDAWSLPEVMTMLHKLMKAGKMDTVDTTKLTLNGSSVLAQFGYFAMIEMARLECLLGDHSASLSCINKLNLHDHNELFMHLPICHFNVKYHVGVCNMLLKRFSDALDAFSDIILYVLRILKPGAGSALRSGVPSQLQRMMDKVLSLTALLVVISPSYPLDDSVREAVEGKYEEKMRRLRAGDRASAVELFESSCPKFISPMVPDYSVHANVHQVVFEHQSAVLLTEVMQHVPFIQLRSFLSMYASVDIAKLARFMCLSEGDMISLLLSYKNKVAAQQKASKHARNSDFHFTIEGGVLVVEATPVKSNQQLHERHFASGTRKHHEIVASINKTFASLGI